MKQLLDEMTEGAIPRTRECMTGATDAEDLKVKENTLRAPNLSEKQTETEANNSALRIPCSISGTILIPKVSGSFRMR
ncbi:hypothetical protein [Photorhabdus luminescens]|uniref:hypothetical protein n=1 Tax=Photorhabdus luminescens TaxID=29488 RepID=UPI001864F00B|nr:hypothetical protein [Photorhabdus luminescens]